MKLSVILSAYNSQDTISQAIESVLTQSFRDFEFIIIDDGSMDNTAAIVGDYQEKDKRIVLIQQENKGLTKSLNTGINLAKGEYIARQDADDLSSPDRLLEQVNFLDRNKEIGFAGSSCEVVDEKGYFLNYAYAVNNPKKNIARLKKQNIFCHGSMIFRRLALNNAHGYRDFFKYAQDYDLYLRLIEFTIPGAVNRVLYRRRIRLDSISIATLNLQLAYANLAKRCYQYRLLNQDDNSLLQDSFLEDSVRLFPCGYTLPFMKSLYSIKRNDIETARNTIRPYLFPVSINKQRLYALWFFSYMPSGIRNLIFMMKTGYRNLKNRFIWLLKNY
ncbi:MAG TPA: glycosyltransferase [Candidatus Omnitrophota bacterium]|nr:glycosyltransferase [Candidatus Omnitrophota bacterium]